MKKKNLGYIILFSFVAIGCLWAFISAGIITKNFQKRLQDNSLGNQKMTIENLLVTETKEGIKYWELFAEQGYYDNKNGVAVLENLVGNFYKENEVVASFESSKGTYNQATRQIILYEKTLIVYKDGSNISADNITWSGKESDIIAKENVRLEKPNQSIVYGDKAILNSSFDNLQIIGRTKTEIYNKGNFTL